MAYERKSFNAMFSRIEEKLETFGAQLDRIEAHLVATDSRVTSLETSRTEQRVKTGLLAAAVSACMMVVGWWVQWKSK